MEKRLFALADNRLTEIGTTWNEPALKLEIEELSLLTDLDLSVTGFSTSDIDRVLDASPQNPGRDDTLPPLSDQAVCQHGDVWVLGDHRVYCGSPLEPSSYTALLQGQAAQMVISAPPDNFSLSHFTPKSQRLEFLEASGEMADKKLIGFLSRFFLNVQGAVANGAIIYVLINQKYSFHLQCAAHPTFGLAKDVSVWVKDVADSGSLYQSQHELVYIFKNGQAPHINNLGNGRTRTTIWDYSSPYTGENQQPLAMHTAAKPCAMYVDAMLDCSDRGGIVLDCFGGNGVSVIAAERTGRHARVIEFYPLYVDLIVRRWQICTGNSAKHGATGHTFDTVSAEASR